MRETFGITNLEAGHPPMFHIWLIAIGDMDAAPAAHNAFVFVIKILEPMQSVRVPSNGRILAIDLERIERLVTARVSGALKDGQRSVFKSRQKRAGVIDPDFFHLAGEGVFSLLDESLGHRGYAGDPAVQPERGIDAMRQQVAGDAAAGGLCVKPPKSGAALREIRGNCPVLEKIGAVMEDPSELA